MSAQMLPILPICSDWRPLDVVMIGPDLGVPALPQRLTTLGQDLEGTEVARVLFPVMPFTIGPDGRCPLPSLGLSAAFDHLGAQRLHGNWTVLDGWRIGVDRMAADEAVRQFLKDPAGKALVAGWIKARSTQATTNQTHLRVLTDVFVVGVVRWRVESPSSRSEDSSTPLADDVLHSWTARDKHNQGLCSSVRFIAGTNNSLTFDQVFERQMVFGYHGLDYPVLEDGTLGAPVPTRDRLHELTARTQSQER